jgi:hypothetical protein
MHYELNLYSNQRTITDIFFLTVSPYFATTDIFLMFYVHEFKVYSKV